MNILDFGAVGDGLADNTETFAAAMAKAAALGGGTITVPAGTFRTGSVDFVSNVTLHLEAGSVISGIESLEAYPVVTARWEGVTRLTHAPLLGGTGLRNVAITGRGTVDGNGAFWWKPFRERKLEHPRPRLVSFSECDNLLLEGFTAVNSPSWTINPVRCANVRISGLTVKNPADSPNTDGINPDSCSRVRISDCYVSVGDDCITLKSGTEREDRNLMSPCEDICVTNCVLESGHGGVVIGSEMSGGVRRVVISNCVFNGTDRGIRLKSRRGRGGTIEDILVSNVFMNDVLCPFTMNLFYGCNGGWGNAEIMDKAPRSVCEGTPVIRNVRFNHVVARGCKLAAGFAYGLPEAPLEDISFANCDISMDVSAVAPGQAEMGEGFPDLSRSGFFLRNVSGGFRSFTVRGQDGPAFDADGSVNMTFSA